MAGDGLRTIGIAYKSYIDPSKLYFISLFSLRVRFLNDFIPFDIMFICNQNY